MICIGLRVAAHIGTNIKPAQLHTMHGSESTWSVLTAQQL